MTCPWCMHGGLHNQITQGRYLVFHATPAYSCRMNLLSEKELQQIASFPLCASTRWSQNRQVSHLTIAGTACVDSGHHFAPSSSRVKPHTSCDFQLIPPQVLSMRTLPSLSCCSSNPSFNLKKNVRKAITSNWKVLPSPWDHFNFLTEYPSSLFTCNITCNYSCHREEKKLCWLLVPAVRETPRDHNALLLFWKKNSFCALLIWLDLEGETARQLSPLLPMQASGLSRDKRCVVPSDRLLPRLRYSAFLFYSPSKLVTAKRFPWWKISFNIYFLPDTLLFFYWVECAPSLSKQVFMQSWL